MHRNTVLKAMAGCLAIFFNYWTLVVLRPRRSRKLPLASFPPPTPKRTRSTWAWKSREPFTLQDIKAPYVLIEIMRTTCPHCVAQVPALNQLYQLVAIPISRTG